MSDDQRVSWNLPRALVDQVKAYQEAQGLESQSAAATSLLAASLAGGPHDPASPSNERHPAEASE